MASEDVLAATTCLETAGITACAKVLPDAGQSLAQPVRCITAELQVAYHLGYEPDAGNFHDMHVLRDRLGIPLPSPYDE